jgi:hypothetical protein
MREKKSMSTALRALLHKHRETYRRLVELEMADLDHQVAALDKPKANAAALPQNNPSPQNADCCLRIHCLRIRD